MIHIYPRNQEKKLSYETNQFFPHIALRLRNNTTFYFSILLFIIKNFTYAHILKILLYLLSRIGTDYNALLFFITGYRQCPVRLQLSNATPVSMTLSTTRTGGQYPTSATNKSNPSCHSLRQGHC